MLPDDLLYDKPVLEFVSIHINPQLRMLSNSFFAPIVEEGTAEIELFSNNGFTDFPESYFEFLQRADVRNSNVHGNPLTEETRERIRQIMENKQ